VRRNGAKSRRLSTYCTSRSGRTDPRIEIGRQGNLAVPVPVPVRGSLAAAGRVYYSGAPHQSFTLWSGSFLCVHDSKQCERGGTHMGPHQPFTAVCWGLEAGAAVHVSALPLCNFWTVPPGVLPHLHTLGVSGLRNFLVLATVVFSFVFIN
jgi:hypothetical protein